MLKNKHKFMPQMSLMDLLLVYPVEADICRFNKQIIVLLNVFYNYDKNAIA